MQRQFISPVASLEELFSLYDVAPPHLPSKRTLVPA
jgi:hypothetical protein